MSFAKYTNCTCGFAVGETVNTAWGLAKIDYVARGHLEGHPHYVYISVNRVPVWRTYIPCTEVRTMKLPSTGRGHAEIRYHGGKSTKWYGIGGLAGEIKKVYTFVSLVEAPRITVLVNWRAVFEREDAVSGDTP